MSGFEHLYVSSSLFEDYDLVLSLSPPPHPPTPGAKDEKTGTQDALWCSGHFRSQW